MQKNLVQDEMQTEEGGGHQISTPMKEQNDGTPNSRIFWWENCEKRMDRSG
jgi:hypothetical protein